ncbi:MULTISPECIES: helix-turn-helix domain-containing protein [Bacillota]|uniref:Helix-turn-helix domain-containing protein n=1 Tax=Anaerococcus faecalis TaxID=2742993 RepID=A0ABX2NAJ3_9FIRM|nr:MULTISPECIES: helix-turn-helix domain-containing protein [Bacillota]KAA9324506.1 helix-turn-helix domain-containing protein [Streptococcus anginosus]NVF11716.1 helix-turn-helix domain-containing protein [Anaerococcus faecalis]BDQ55630.1 hypothetical protein EfsSVR2330_31410 [Enterococcus faecalis]SFE00645.1 DNA binding domain-containing protein, excisionase family [Peptostreptococcaceae bacterium pGA-8]
MNNKIEKWTSLKDIQIYLGVGRETILQWIAKREMPAYKVGRLWKFKISEVDEWIRSGGASDDNYKLETPEEKSTNSPLNNSNEGDKNVCN